MIVNRSNEFNIQNILHCNLVLLIVKLKGEILFTFWQKKWKHIGYVDVHLVRFIQNLRHLEQVNPSEPVVIWKSQNQKVPILAEELLIAEGGT